MSTVARRILLSLPLLALALDAGLAYGQQQAFAQAASAYREGDWSSAAAQFQHVLSSATNSESQQQAQFYLAECQMQLGQYASAGQHYQRVIESTDQELATRALFRCGEAALFAGSEQEAEGLLRQYLRVDADSSSAAYAWMYLGELAERRGDTDEATAAYRTVAKRYPTSTHASLARLAVAEILLANGQSDHVSQILVDETASHDKSIAAEALLLLGRAEFEQQRYEQALNQFRQVAKRFPSTSASYRARIAAAWALWRLEWYEAIKGELAPLAHQPPWLADYHYLLGMVAYGREDWSSGTKQLAKALALRPDHPSHDAMLFYQGVCYLRANRIAAAESVLERLCAEHPESAWRDDALWELSRLARGKQDQAKHNSAALSQRQKAPVNDTISSFYDIEIPPSPADNLPEAQALLDKAVGLERDGHFHRAIVCYQELAQLKPSNALVHEGIWRSAKLHQSLKRKHQAEALFERLLTEDPTSPHAADSLAALGTLNLTGGNKASATKHFGLLLEKFPQSAQAARAAYWLARLAADENDSEQALINLEAALATFEVLEPTEDRQQKLLAQVVALKCQLLARNEQWPQLRGFATGALSQLQPGTESVKVEFWLAEAEFRSRHFDEARTRFEKLQPHTVGIQEDWVAMVPLRRAQLLAQRLQWKEVLKRLDQLESDYPDFALQYEVDYLRGRALAGRGKLSTARDYYEEVLQDGKASAETSVAAQWMIGETYFHQQNYETARVAYQRVIDRFEVADWQARAALQIGKCWELEQNWQQARETYTSAIARWPDAQPQKQIETRLELAKRHGNPRR